MAINLASKYSGKIQEKFKKSSFLAGNTSNAYDFAGVRSLTIYTPETVPLNNYKRDGANRFGTPVEMEDTIQELTMTQDKSFALTIDKGNNSDQLMTKEAGKMMKLQIEEQVTPYTDKYAIRRFIEQAGTIKGVTAPTKSTIIGMIFDAATALDDFMVPDNDRILYVPTSVYNMIRLSPEFIGVDKLAEQSLVKGQMGMIADMKVIKMPQSYFPVDTYFLITYKQSVLFPFKIKTARILKNAPGIDGALLEGRQYFDAFVIGTKANGVYAAVKSDKVVATPTIAISSNSATVTSTTGSATIKYTTDGTDPRYSKTALTYSTAVTLTSGQTIRAYAEKADMFASGVADKVNP